MRVRALCIVLTACLLTACEPPKDVQQGMIAAIDHAIREARKVQAQLAETGQCPQALAGWQFNKLQDALETEAGTEKVRFKLGLDCYKVSELRFGIVVKYSFDAGDSISGGATGPLEVMYGHFTAPCTFAVSSADDSLAAATRAVHDAAKCDGDQAK